jgi:6-phosphofructokinase 1
MADDFTITRVRPATIPTPHRCAGRLQSGAGHGPAIHYVKDDDRILVDIATSDDHARSMERAGPRELIAWDPAKATAAVLTSGGLCPGLNAVIASIVHSLHYHYGVSRILGVPNGYAGLMTPKQRGIAPLTLERIRGIANTGGSCLGSARIQPNVEMIADTLAAYAVDMLFCIGGDGTQRGAHAIHEEIASRHLETAVVGVPKTIDNDISWVDKTFGFDTAVEIARTAVTAAHTEAEAAINGVGLVKLMGRDSGFIAANAGIASSDANFVLVPEVPFELEGEQGLFASLKRRLADRGHAVIVVAEGAGQELMAPAAAAFDQSGNKLHQDIGLYLKERINAFFKTRGLEINLKYIDPGYIIRAAPANASDAIFCAALGHHAVHAALSGRTDMVVGSWNGVFTHVPIPLAVQGRKKIEPDGEIWRTVLETTGQSSLVNPPAHS